MKAGTTIAGRYVIEHELARGGMGTVYVARDEKLGTRVAVKVASLPREGSEQVRERFRREARIGSLLGQTAGFVRALDWGEVDAERLYLAMDLVEGARPLDLENGPLDERLRRVRDVARLVATAHGRGVIHRDLKPANVLQSPDGSLRLSDFGLARGDGVRELARSATLTSTGAALGTAPYMAPEQFEDSKRADARADVYALGVLLFLALAGRHPYPGTLAAILRGQKHVATGREPAPRPSAWNASVPPALDALALSALELDRSRRLATAAELASALDRFLESVPRGDATTVLEAGPADRSLEIEGFEVLERIGAGGMGAVHRARDEKTGEEVALKALRAGLPASARELFLREARAGARIHHPHAVRVLGSGSSRGRAYLVMELVRGPDLGRYLEETGRPLELAPARAIFAQILSALAHAHSKKLVHRDVKPSNVLLVAPPPEPLVKLGDFGLLRSLEESGLTGTGEGRGTPGFMAPEQREDARHAGPAADLYGLAATFFFLVTREVPDERGKPPSLRARRPEISAGLDGVIRRCLARDPRERYTSAQALEEAFRRAR